MKWSELIRSISFISKDNSLNDPDIKNLVYDSRRVSFGTVYVAIPGFKDHGDNYIDQAIESGAVAIVSQNAVEGKNVSWIQVENPRLVLGLLARNLWGHVLPKDLVSVGITGTNGKTTTAYLFNGLLSELYTKNSCWVLGTIEYNLGGKILNAPNTTPESAEIYKLINEYSDSNIKALTMEVSSHALALDRISGLKFTVAVWTNLTQDHLDFHKDMEDYFNTKKKLFTDYMYSDGVAIINIDDKWGLRLSNDLSGRKIITYGKNESADIKLLSANCTWSGTKIEILFENEVYRINSKLVGFFNVYNIMALWAGAVSIGVKPNDIVNVLKNIKPVPGRIQRIEIDSDFMVVVDYAHTPDALKQILNTAQKMTKGKLICVFGCGGDRDVGKRPIMGEVVSHYSDYAVVTSDNPRTENPDDIISDIVSGIPLDFTYDVIVDRKTAIKKAMENANADDCIIVAGKGHESYQEINGVRHHFDDKETIEEIGHQLELSRGRVNK